MINVSNEFRQMLDDDKRSYKLKLDITLNDGTELTILNNKIWENGFSISDATSGNNRFDIGSVISNKMVANLKNTDKEFSKYDFYNSEIVAWVGLELEDGTIEYLRKGTYFVDDPLENESSMNLECLDYLAKFDRPYSDSALLYPATLGQIVVDACSVCGVTLVSASFPNSDYVVKERPDDEAITFRDVIGYAAQISCCFAKADAYGRLFFGWYDTKEVLAPRVLATSEGEAIATSDSELLAVLVKATEDDYINNSVETKLHRIVALSSQEIALSDTVITGIVVTENADSSEAAKSYMYGNEGYVLSVSNNKLIQKGNGMDAAKRIGRRAVGLKFRKMNISCLSDPSMEAGDRAYIIDRKKNVYVTYITSTDFKPGNYQKVECSAETPSKKKSPNYDMATKLRADARENTKKQIGDYDLAVQSLTSLITQSLGIFKTEEVLEDKSVIYYMHNKPTLAESQTIWKMTADAFAVSTDGGETWNAGMDSEGNAVVNILSAVGIRFDWARGGTLTLGGYDNISGSLILLDEDGDEIWRLNNEGMFASFTRDIGTYTESDMQRLQGIVVGSIQPTETDYERLDVDKNGFFNIWDMIIIQRMLNGLTTSVYKTNVSIKPYSQNEIFSVETVDSSGSAVSSSKMGWQGLISKKVYFERCISSNFDVLKDGVVETGASGTFTSSDGRTVTVTNGIITSIL